MARGFRRCAAPICRVSRTRVVWPSEWRTATGWGLVHLACRPSPQQAAMLQLMAGFGRMAGKFRELSDAANQAMLSVRRLSP